MNSVAEYFEEVDPKDDPIGWLKDTVTLGGVTVTSPKKKGTFLEDLLGGVNKVLGGVKLPTVKTGVDDKSIVSIGIMLVVVALIFSSGRRR